jgi:EAL domain-containing protein (putative c-di-GMP-specific phosphodiesterase class I)
VLENDLRSALEQRQFEVHYQPLVDVATRRIVSLEALVRWRHPQRGLIPPGAFIPVAEESGLIVSLGESVLRTACEQVAAWIREGVDVVPIAVNLSPVQLRAGDVGNTVRRVLQETGMPPDLLVLELTESTLIDNVGQRVEDLQQLRKLGIGIALDDFGTGYSALSYLRTLPIDVLKIDRSFVRHVDVNPVDASIVNAIVAMAHSLGLRVVAEGVETAAQLRVLAESGCDVAQGFLFARPVPAAACKALLAAGEASRAPSRAQWATGVEAPTPAGRPPPLAEISKRLH